MMAAMVLAVHGNADQEVRPVSRRGASRLTENLSATVLATVAYFIAGKLGLQLAFMHASATAVWPPSGIALAAFLLFGYRLWPGIFLGAFLVNITTAGSLFTALGIATGNTLEGVTGAYLVRRYANGWRAFERWHDTVRFCVLACVVSTTIAATIGVASVCVTGFAPWSSFGPIWMTWWLGDAVGGFIVSSVIILWYLAPRPGWTGVRALEFAGVILSTVFVGLLVFRDVFPHGYVCVPPLLWAALRFGPRETATAVFLLTAVAIWGTLRASGPYSVADRNASLLLLQAFIGVTAVTSMIVAAVVLERQRAVDALRDAHRDLELRHEERTREFLVADGDRVRAEEQLIVVARRRAEDLRDFAVSVQDVLEDERGRIARELHDDLGQRLTGLKMGVQLLEDEVPSNGSKPLARLRLLRRELDAMINVVRRLSHNLHPSALDDFGLVVALQTLCNDFQKIHQIQTRFEAREPMGGFHDPHVDIALYRMAQEALANVAKHANASKASVELSGRPDAITLVVLDNGRGFDMEGFRARRIQGHRLGLIGMRERCELLGGEFVVESTPGQGTRIEARLPLQPQVRYEPNQDSNRR
jgi:signal transduction histidine kinase